MDSKPFNNIHDVSHGTAPSRPFLEISSLASKHSSVDGRKDSSWPQIVVGCGNGMRSATASDVFLIPPARLSESRAVVNGISDRHQ